MALTMQMACSDASLDTPSIVEPSSGSTTTLPPHDSAQPPASTADDSGSSDTGEPDGPALCEPGCEVGLALDWVYEGGPNPIPGEPGNHRVPRMLREADGTLTIAEQRERNATIHQIDGQGHHQFSVLAPVGEDPYEVGDIGWHPSGDLLVSAVGVTPDDRQSLVALRYDLEDHAVVWSSAREIWFAADFFSSAGGIVALDDTTVAQLYLRPEDSLQSFQSTHVAVWGPDGVLIEDQRLLFELGTTVRPPLLADRDPEGRLAVGLFRGSDNSPFGQVGRLQAPLWGLASFTAVLDPLDDLLVDARGHAYELFHSPDADQIHLVLTDRAGTEPLPRWTATLAVPTLEPSRASMAIGPDGDVYAAVRTANPPAPDAAPLTAVTFARWTADGEHRFTTGVLLDMTNSEAPLELAVDDDEGLIFATVVDHRLRVERRTQRCLCG